MTRQNFCSRIRTRGEHICEIIVARLDNQEKPSSYTFINCLKVHGSKMFIYAAGINKIEIHNQMTTKPL